MKISIITVAYNAEEFLAQCIRSVIGQTHPDIEYIVIDGGSSDTTLRIIEQYKRHINVLVSEKDNGIYDGMNKGIRLASGEVIGILNADDFFADTEVISDVASAFSDTATDIVYGNLWYVKRTDTDAIIRKWISKPFSRNAMNWGWMPAHPAFYARKDLFDRHGYYNLKFHSAADYELMIRFMYLNRINSFYLNRLFVKMRVGGVSNQSFTNRLSAGINDFKAMQENGLKLPWLKVFIKPIRKINQYFN